jgi:hypothetical protein
MLGQRKLQITGNNYKKYKLIAAADLFKSTSTLRRFTIYFLVIYAAERASDKLTNGAVRTEDNICTQRENL